jgi:predicted ATPase
VANANEHTPELDLERVGSFELEGVLGHGAMGVVYAGRAPDGTAAAVKLMHSRDANAELVRRFEREGAVRVDHPNVVRVLGAGTDERGAPFIAFERLEGESLRDYLKHRSPTPAEIVDLVRQAAAGAAAAHEAGIVHRDLKPGNLFVCHDGTVKLLDFGVAFFADEDDRVTQGERRAIGTPSFLSPEQAQGDSDIDGRADVWALGVILFEALSGIRPFKKETALATMLAVVVEEPPALEHLVPHIPHELAELVHRCLRKQRQERWESADALLGALSALDLSMAAGGPAPGPGSEAATQTVLQTATTSFQAEKRVVSLVLCTDVEDMASIERIVTGQGGLLVPILGKAIGLFGGETWEGDEMVRAATAALAAREHAGRVAVASGRASLSGQGISGAVVRRAEAGCEAGLRGVAVDVETARVLQTGFALRLASEGLQELTATRRPIWPLEASQDSYLPPTRGREVELAQLRRIADDVLEEERAHALLAVGPPGIGKSRLLRHMERILEEADRNVFVLSARADPLRRTRSVSLLAMAIEGRARLNHMLRGAPRVDVDAPIEDRQRAVQALVSEALDSDADRDETAAFIGELLGVAMPETPALRAARSDPRLMADRLQLAVHDYLAGLVSTRAVALLFDDLQWADAASLDVLDMLLDRLSDHPLVVFGTARPELEQERSDLFAGRELVRVELRGLSQSDIAKLSESIAAQPLSEGVIKAVYERSGGNPLFAEQIVLALREDGHLDDPPDELPLPLTVEAAVQSRLDHLPSEEKELCKRAAIFERPFSVDEIAALGVPDVESRLSSLRRRDLLASRARSREDQRREYRFRSALMARVAYRMNADEQLRELHLGAAGMLDRREDIGREEVARHYERGEEHAAAARRYAEATRAAVQRFDTESVLRCAERALSLEVDDDQRFELYMARAEVLRFLGHHDEQHRDLAEAYGYARSDEERARALAEQSAWMARRGMVDEARDTAEQALACARETEDEEVLTLSLCRLAAARIYAGSLSEAERPLSEASALAHASVHKLKPLAADLRAQLASARGDLGGRRKAFRAAAELYAEAGDLRRAANAELNLADVSNRVGAYDMAASALTDALQKCRRVGNRLGEGYALLNLGYALIMDGRVEDGMERLREAAALAETARDARLAVFVRVYQARGRLQRGLDPAEFDPAEAAAEAEAVGLPGVAVLALTAAAQAALLRGDAADALAASEKAMEMRDRLGGVEEDEAEVYLAHARALRLAGRDQEADRVIAAGKARLEAVASQIVDPEWRRRFLRDVAAHRELTGA